MVDRWTTDPQYSHGYLVPLFSLYLLWSRRKMLADGWCHPSGFGLVVLLIGLGIRAYGTLYFYVFIDEFSLLVCLMGLALILGSRVFRWSLPSVLFLTFMIPLPFEIQNALGLTLQMIAAQMSTYFLQTFGIPSVREGNVIVLSDVRLAVAQACSGLGMMMTFFAIATAVAILLKKDGWWRKAIVVLGAIPIAILVNVIRITVTGMLYSVSQNDLARIVFHDIAGWLMMPLAILFILLELYIVDRLIIDYDPNSKERGPVPFLIGVPNTRPLTS
jgi:exosortase